MSRTKTVATLSIDLDNLWCYQRSFGIDSWQHYPSFLEIAIPRILDFLDEHQLRLTAFIIGRDAQNERLAPLFAEIAKRGHEIGNHSFDHAIDLHAGSKEAILADIQRADEAIIAATGQKPIGFRGPAFGVSRTLLECLLDSGFVYDSSTLPNTLGALARHYHRKKSAELGTPTALEDSLYGSLKESRRPLHAYRWALDGGFITEVPLSSMPLFRLPFHGTYLNYLADSSEFLAMLYYRSALACCRVARIAPSFLLHATDFLGNEDCPGCHYLPGMKRSTQRKLALMSKILTCYRKQFEVMPLQERLGQLDTLRIRVPD